MSRPLVIIGAPRSGTNMLRDALCRLESCVTWPCDEINYIWRHGNRNYPSDELPRHLARPDVHAYVRQQFRRINRTGAAWTVEKTCANSLRVPFVDKVLPSAHYIFIVRDGRDAVASSMLRWSAKLEWSYLLKKAKFVPAADIPYYGGRFLRNQCSRLFSAEKNLSSWGPVTAELRQLVKTQPLPLVCANQWKRCVEQASRAFMTMDQSRIVRLRYEDLVENPRAQFAMLLEFLELSATSERVEQLARGVNPRSVGKWRTQFPPAIASEVETHLAATLEAHGYSRDRQPTGQAA